MTEIVPHLTMVINEYIKEQKFPSTLKKGLIPPLHKKRSAKPFELQTIESICKQLDNYDSSYSVCIDLSKALDSISHQILMNKLKFIGFNDEALTLIFGFLSHRSQPVVTNNTVSDFNGTFQGVSQETVLGPLFLTSTLTILQNTSQKNAKLSIRLWLFDLLRESKTCCCF